MPVAFNKPATTTPEQIALLQKRGLIISDEESIKHYFSHIGYYRLAGYWQIYQSDRTNHIFKAGTTIDEIIDLYNFDRELRLLLLDAIERIEVSFRAVLLDEMCCRYGPTWYSEEQYFYSREDFVATMNQVDKELERTNEEFIKHHDRKYGIANYPPAWKTLQVLSFGTLSKIYGNINNNVPEKKTIAKKYGLPAEDWLHSWIQVISVLRNYCAHHCRVCYRTFSFPPKEMRRPKLAWIQNMPPAGGQTSQLLYYQLCAVRYLLHTCSPGNSFSKKLKFLIATYPSMELTRMGFMKDWENEPLWAS
jgi:abortive infection bacteriophage resistance protein